MNSITDFLAELAEVTISEVLPRDSEAKPGYVFIGCGAYRDGGEDCSGWLVLNDKSTKSRYGNSFNSVTHLVASPPEGLLESWSLWAKRPLSPAKALEQMTLVVEDASPDSVFGLLLLLARLYEVDIDGLPKEWIDVIDDWERTGNCDDPWSSWCALESCLAHSQFPVAEPFDARALATAWTDCMRFGATCLERKLSPTQLPKLQDSTQWQRAQTLLGQEQDVYLGWLKHANQVQLSLPVDHAKNRCLLIDALFFEEDQVTGAAKNFYRNDREHSPLKEGFALAAHYRPSAVGTGNDITISVDPRRGVHLLDLWRKLEQMEEEAWQGDNEERPTDKPRNLEVLNDQNKRESLGNRYNEPWYINPEKTLIGAPHGLKNDGPGPKLGWKDVCDAIWELYNPVKDVMVCPVGSEEPVPLTQLQPEKIGEHDKKILLADWPSGKSNTGCAHPRTLSSAPVVSRILTALIKRPLRMPTVEELPTSRCWDEVKLTGGFAVVSLDGVFVLDDWTPDQRLHFDSIRKTINHAAALDKELASLAEETKSLTEEVGTLLDKGSAKKKVETEGSDLKKVKVESILRKAAIAGCRLAGLRGSHATPPDSFDARLVWDALDRHWGLEKRLSAIEGETQAVEKSLRSLADLRTARVSRLVAIYGFPLFVAGPLAPPLGKLLYSLFWGATADMGTPGWLVLTCFVLVSVLLSISFHLWIKKHDPLHESEE